MMYHNTFHINCMVSADGWHDAYFRYCNFESCIL